MLPVLVVAFVALCVLGLWLTSGQSSSARAPVQPPPAPPDELGFIRDQRPRAATPPSVPPPAARVVEADAGAPSSGPDGSVAVAPFPSPAPLVAGPGPRQPKDPNAPPPSAGAIDKEAIKRAIESVKPLIRQCFEDAQERFPPPQKVVLSFTIVGQGISGHFDEGEIKESTIVDPWVQSCFLDSLGDARFPVPEGGGTVSVTYPFSFAASADKVPAPE